MSEPNLEEALSRPSRRRLGLSPELGRERKLEQMRRAAAARDLADSALARLHPEEHKSLMAQARTKVDRERGPLPGDSVEEEPS